MSPEAYDLVIIGAGSGGLSAAEMAVKMGASVALVESAPDMGGECLHTGCVPSKALIAAAKTPDATWRTVQTHVKAAIKHIQEDSDNAGAYRDMGVAVFFGNTQLQPDRRVKVGKHTLRYKKLLLATGSTPQTPNINGLQSVGFETNETVFTRKLMPKSLAVIGGGPIAAELAFALSNLGIEVSIIEHNSQILHNSDGEAAALVRENLEQKGVHVHTSASVASIRKKGRKKEISIHHGESRKAITAAVIMVATGRRANVPRGIIKQGVRLENGFIAVDDRWQTSNENIYAVGDCTNFGRYFAHVAAVAATQAVVHALYGLKSRQDLRNQPSVFFTEPEVAQVGPTPAQLDKDAASYRLHHLPFTDIDKALVDKQAGFMKVATGLNGRILSATIAGQNAGELIGYFALAIDKKWRLSDLASAPLPYPTLSSGIKDLAWQAQLQTIEDRQKWLGLARKLKVR